MNSFTKRLHKVVRLLKKKLPPAYPVAVSVVNKKIVHDGDDCYALSWLDLKNKKFYITISRVGGCYGCMIDALEHEWAHILDWSHLHDMSEEPSYHSPTWGVKYAEVYRVSRNET